VVICSNPDQGTIPDFSKKSGSDSLATVDLLRGGDELHGGEPELPDKVDTIGLDI
jgi:hypothetical protein